MDEKELLKFIRHIALATVNEDGSPHNTPLFFAIDDKFENLIFVSRVSSLHSRNLLRTREAFATIFDSNEFHGGIYLKLENARIAGGDEFKNCLKVFENKCKELDNSVLPLNFYLIDDGYRLFVLDINKVEVYGSVEDEKGKLIKEQRREIDRKELL